MSHNCEEECSQCDGVFKYTNSSLSEAESGKEVLETKYGDVGRARSTECPVSAKGDRLSLLALKTWSWLGESGFYALVS